MGHRLIVLRSSARIYLPWYMYGNSTDNIMPARTYTMQASGGEAQQEEQECQCEAVHGQEPLMGVYKH